MCAFPTDCSPKTHTATINNNSPERGRQFLDRRTRQTPHYDAPSLAAWSSSTYSRKRPATATGRVQRPTNGRVASNPAEEARRIATGSIESEYAAPRNGDGGCEVTRHHQGGVHGAIFPRWLLREADFRQLAHVDPSTVEKRREEASMWIKKEVRDMYRTGYGAYK